MYCKLFLYFYLKLISVIYKFVFIIISLLYHQYKKQNIVFYYTIVLHSNLSPNLMGRTFPILVYDSFFRSVDNGMAESAALVRAGQATE